MDASGAGSSGRRPGREREGSAPFDFQLDTRQGDQDGAEAPAGEVPSFMRGAEGGREEPAGTDGPRTPDAPRRSPPVRRTGADGPETFARIAWALPWIAFAITVIVLGGAVFAAAMLALAAISLIELFRITRAGGFQTVAIAVAAGMIIAAHSGNHFHIVLAGAAAFPLIFLAAAIRPSTRGATAAMATTVFGIAWIGVPVAHAVLLRELPEHGAALLVDVLVATFVADTAAYAVGRMFGRHPLVLHISPNKTVEGLLGGLVGGTMGFWFAGLYQDWLPGIDALLMGLCVAALAPIGDLFESMVKRDLEVKDSGTVVGPHGGMLDRLDAVLFTVVAGYYLAVAFVY